MTTPAGKKRQVLAKFISDVPPKKGWWFRLPSLSTSGKKRATHPTDCCLPHLGVLFGMSEDCMARILLEMECLVLKNSGTTTTTINQPGWVHLRDEFRLFRGSRERCLSKDSWQQL
jgi:hypothetical protein